MPEETESDWSPPYSPSELDKAVQKVIAMMGTGNRMDLEAFVARFHVDPGQLDATAKATVHSYVETFMEDISDFQDPNHWSTVFVVGLLSGLLLPVNRDEVDATA